MASNDQETAPGISHLDKDDILRHLRKGGVMIFILLGLAMTGIAITDFRPAKSLYYWLCMAPVFAVFCIYMHWSQIPAEGRARFRMALNQILHWAGFLAGIYVVFRLHGDGRLNDPSAGLVAMLLLAMSTFFTGLHNDWRVLIVGTTLLVATLAAAWVEEFFWIALVPIPILIFIGYLWYKRAMRDPLDDDLA